MFRIQQNAQYMFNSAPVQQQQQTVYISQKDFEKGPYVITESGKYILTEDIVFDPFPNKFEDIFDSLVSFPDHNHNFVLGYFAAIIIYGSNIDLDLGGYTIRQSYIHNLQQRFFSIIELADRPFMPGQGPANFGSPLVGCSNVVIRNGILGFSSHHGIHGNKPVGVTIQDVVIYDYEVAGISINGGQNITMTNVEVRHNYKNVLVNALFSNAIFTIKKLMLKERHEPSATITVNNSSIGIHQIYERLYQSVIDAYTDIVNNVDIGTTNPDSKIYLNPSKLTDGNCYGISLNAPGLLVNEYKQELEPGSSQITLTNVTIADIDCNPTEVLTVTPTSMNQLGLNPQTFPVVNKGPFGDVINYWNCVNESGQFESNALVLAQIMTGTVSQSLLDWIKSGSSDFNDRVKELTVLNNLDIMAHVMKGTIGLFLSSVENVVCKGIKIYSIHNQSEIGNQDYLERGHAYVGARTCGVLVASSKVIRFEDVSIHDIVSKNGEAYGYYLYGKCKQLTFPTYFGNIGSLKTTADYSNPSKSTKSVVKNIGMDDTYQIV